jgi:thiamine-monophosphate kinase
LKEFEFIDQLSSIITNSIEIGIGDDAAMFDGFLISKDIMAENVHFTSNAPLEKVIFKLFTCNVSDIAAMGAETKYALMGASIPSHIDKSEILNAVMKACKFYNVELIGGDTTSSSDSLVLSLTVIGKREQNVLTRSGASVDEYVYLSRPVGKCSEYLQKELDGETCYDHYDVIAEQDLGKFLGTCPEVTSCIDISDGLGRDLSHIADMSNVGVNIIADNLPPEISIQNQISSGEEYAICFTAKKDFADKLEQKVQQNLNRSIIKIGHTTSDKGVFLLEENSKTDISNSGFEHKI